MQIVNANNKWLISVLIYMFFLGLFKYQRNILCNLGMSSSMLFRQDIINGYMVVNVVCNTRCHYFAYKVIQIRLYKWGSWKPEEIRDRLS